MSPIVEYYLNMPESTFLTLSLSPPSGLHNGTLSIVTFFSTIKSPLEMLSLWIMCPLSLGSIY